MSDKNSYFNRAHRLGRIGALISILFMVEFPSSSVWSTM